jgi:hypothetical protein
MSKQGLKFERELREQWEVAHENVHELERLAISKAEVSVNQRLEAMNELRSQIQIERGSYVQREMYEKEHKALSDAIDARLKILENGSSNLQGRMWVIGAVVIIVNIILVIWSRK